MPCLRSTSHWRRLDAQTVQAATQRVAGRDVWLHHPWSLGAGPGTLPADVLHMGVGFDTSHLHTPWSQRRWDFVSQGFRLQTDPHAKPALLHVQALLQSAAPQQAAGPQALPYLFEPVTQYCPSFSAWWKITHLNSLNTLNSV